MRKKVCAYILFIAAIMSCIACIMLFIGNNFTMGIVTLCEGILFLCIGSIYFNQYKKEK